MTAKPTYEELEQRIIELEANSDLRKIENKLREAKQRHRSLVDAFGNSGIGIFIMDDEYRIRYMNQILIEASGDQIGRICYKAIGKMDSPCPFCRLDEVINEGKTIAYQPIVNSGRTYDIVATPYLDTDGKICKLEIIQEITERKQMEEALRESEEIHRVVTNSVSDSIVIIQDEKILWANNKALDKMEYSKNEFIGLDFQKIVHPDDLQSIIQRYQDRLSGKPIEDLFYFRAITRDGKILEVENRGALIRWEKKPASVLTLRDITEEKRKEKENKEIEFQLQQIQKVESIGTLAGGIAHDFNNILYPIVGYAEMTMDDVPKDSRAYENLQGIYNASKRAQDLVQQILTFSRKDDQEQKPLMAQLVVKEALKLLRSSIPKSIEIHQKINNKCGMIMGDPTQVHQIVVNLCTNAYHAMEDSGGKIEITLTEIELDVDDLYNKINLNPGKYLRLSVSDTGQGMPPDIIGKIFNPYFTTKENGKGTGLGLSVIHGIVKNHRGNISVCSEPDIGTTFHVYFPLIEKDVKLPATADSQIIQTGSEHILLVDDEEPIIKMEQQMLERLGYNVTTRTSSLEALEAFRATPNNFDLIITDMTMPNMTGIKLTEKLIEIRKDIPIIICTGFSEQINDEKAKSIGIRSLVMKPIIKSDLAKKIRAALDNVTEGGI